MVRLTDRPDMTLDVYRGRKTTIQPATNAGTYATVQLLRLCRNYSYLNIEDGAGWGCVPGDAV